MKKDRRSDKGNFYHLKDNRLRFTLVFTKKGCELRSHRSGDGSFMIDELLKNNLFYVIETPM